MNIEELMACKNRLIEQTERVVFGSKDLVRHALIAIMVRGHILLEGVPGMAKTLFARTLARSLGLEMRRLQCTPDLMPGDVLGSNIFDFQKQVFRLTRGPVFTEFLLADEINRTPPKTQAALLEAMQERSVTFDGVTHSLPEHHIVVATQNPIEYEGTYPLPEAQLDRFLFKLTTDYPSEELEVRAVTTHCASASMPDIEALGIARVFTPDEVSALKQIPEQIRIESDVIRYAVALSRATRKHQALSVGLSPRAATMMSAASRAQAALEGRDFVIPDDVKVLFNAVACHRIILAPGAELEGIQETDVLNEIVQTIEPPR
ncbi:MAG: MoxR family ATPase [Planctomycetes bacterium]|nr:MoxR family ATPase [Planctomycetota bacterium]